ncbi:XRE family transcriptional regulator [Nitrospina watsonii]|uniref:XRE family transcriptional regulator n=1 Tax=Nitrospina watsonii TaxID=1323948 RepID=UPI00249117C7|nr:XRE family transcriptional regulator [Nitrospina watsonii]
MSENLHKETPINTDMIVLARECRGFTQGELAKKLNTSQGKLSRIEHGLGHVSEEILNKLEDVLGFPRRFFFENSEVYWPLHVCNRKKSKLPQKTYLNLVAKANVRQIHIQKLLRSVEIPNRIPDWDFDEFDRDPLKVAQALRHFWNIPRGPIKNVTKILEDAGIFVIHSDFYSSSIDGFTMFFKGISPIVFINSRLPGDRLRFSLAHELGHIVMHKIPNNFMENEADEFASEFLMPSMEIKSSLSKLTFEKLASLKLYWMVSMAALLMKAGQLGKISSRTQRYWFMQLSKRGWRLREPEELAIDQEKPSLLKEVLGIHLQSLKFSVSELCELLGVFEEEFQLIYLENDKKMRVVK